MTDDRAWCCEGCGTYGGYQMHLRRHEKPCDECRAAHKDYMREYRASRPDARARDRRDNRTRRRAHVRLAQMYPDEYRRLWLEELAKDPG